MKKKLLFLGAICLGIVACLYLACIHYTEPNEVAIVRNWITGELELDNQAGFNCTPPWVTVAIIDIRPARVCLTSAGHAAFNCKLVQFEPRAYQEFIATEGFRYYWFANRFSFNFGYHDEYRGMRDILRGYAFSAKHYSFVRILEEYSEP